MTRMVHFKLQVSTMFSAELPVVTAQRELDAALAAYPDYDQYYVASGSIADRRFRFDHLWKQYAPYADIHFLAEVKKQFHPRTWEMYVGCALLRHRIPFSSNNKGPDFLIESHHKKVWIECTTCSMGSGPDKVPPMEWGVIHSVPEDEMCIRVAHALETKYRQYKKYKERRIVGGNDCAVIAINAGALGFPDGAVPLILKCVFGVAHPTITFPIGGGESKSGWSFRTELKKKSGSNVPMIYFADPAHEEVSAAIYCRNTVLNHPPIIGEDIVVVHNPFAKNPLPNGLFDSFKTYRADDHGKIEL